jgi:N-acetylglucosaminyl-diphospho-decaprenol L-rhamnosyltransferase
MLMNFSKSLEKIDLSIIIINWKSADFLMECLASIEKADMRMAFEIIVVDNASFDGARERLAEQHPSVLFIQSLENLGFSRANNRAVNHARGDTLLFLNPDTEVEERAVDLLYECLRQLPACGAVGGRLLNTDGSLQFACVQANPTILNQVLGTDAFHRWFPRSRLWGAAGLLDRHEGPIPVEVVSGACIMMRRVVFNEVGGFSSEYFMYGEDVDLCYKVAKAGYQNYHLPTAQIVHHGGSSSSQASSEVIWTLMRESRARFFQKHHGRLYAALYRKSMAVAAGFRLMALFFCLPLMGSSRKSRWALRARKWQAVLKWGIRRSETMTSTSYL